MLPDEAGEEDADGVAEKNGVGDLHHGGLEVQGEKHAEFARDGDLLFEKAEERFLAQERGVQNFAGLQLETALENHRGAAVGGLELDGGRGRGGEGDGLFVGAEVVRAHGDDAGFGVLAPRAHFVRMFAGVIFNGFGRTAVGVAFAQDGVNRAAFNFVIARLSVPLTGIARCLGIVGKREALFLQFSYGGFELREGRADVGEFDDVGPGLQGECAEFGQGVGGLLAGGEAVGEGGEEASGEGDIAEFDGDASGAGEGLDDRKERVGGEERGFVCLGVDDGRLGRHELCFISRSASGQNLVVVACDVSEKESAARAPLTTAGYDRAPRDRERRLKLHPVYCGAAGSRRRR